MGSITQNVRGQLACQYIDFAALTLLYYDYALTFGSERRLLWSQRSFKQWGSILFFLNRYCAVLGHFPVFFQLFSQPGSALCKTVYSYHQILAVVLEAIIVLSFVTRTYALYGQNRVVLVALTSLALAGLGVNGFMLTGGEKLPTNPVLPEGLVGCAEGLSWSQSWHLAISWGTVMIFDLIVVAMTLVKTIQLNWGGASGGRTIIHILMRDGVAYFGVISLAVLSNILSFVYGSELTRGVTTTWTNVLSSVLVSRLMINLREQRDHSIQESQPSIPLEFRRRDSTNHTV